MVAVLQLDAAGVPHRWIGIEDAAIYSAKGLVLWEVGTPVKTLRGGINARTGVRSEMDVKPVIALAGGIWCAQEFRTPAPERGLIFARDRYTCAYCAQGFSESQLTVDHIVPESRGGAYAYMNLVAACRECNGRKGARTPEEAGMCRSGHRTHRAATRRSCSATGACSPISTRTLQQDFQGTRDSGCCH